jgi:uncharacterized protein (TIGR03083 family)
MANSAAATIDAIAGSQARIDEICSELDETAWHQPTALPGWDVQDVVAHLGSLEAMLLGREEPPHEVAEVAHVRNPLGALNERLVDRRRSWSGAEVLAEFRAMTALRLEALSALDESALDGEVLAPNGRMVPQRAFIGIRLWDFFVHEMDIADGLGLPEPVDTAAGRRVLDEMLALVPRGLARSGAPEGAVARVEIGAPLPRSVAARFEGGRGLSADPAAGEATLHLRASPATFLMVGSGRRMAEVAIAAGDIEVMGDRRVAARLLSAINVVP